MNNIEKKELDEALFQDLNHFVYNYGYKKGFKTDSTISLAETLKIALHSENGYFKEYMKYDHKKHCVYSLKTGKKIIKHPNIQRVYLMGVENGINKKSKENDDEGPPLGPISASSIFERRMKKKEKATPGGVIVKSLAIPEKLNQSASSVLEEKREKSPDFI